jgi:hypothetical protein
VIGEKGEAELVNYRMMGRFYVVDRLFAAAELRLGGKQQAVVRITRGAPEAGATVAGGRHERDAKRRAAGRGGSGSTSGRSTRKLDPESLVLRGRPRGVVRFRKELIIGIAAVAMIGIGAVAWIGLQPKMPHMVVGGDDNANPANAAKPSGELLANAPKTYGEVPKLGPPLPGDLGKPILDQQRAAIGVSVSGMPSQSDQALAAARQRHGEEVRPRGNPGL